ncbi:MAG: hypothetical protein ACLTMP_13310 [Eggerthella lenta]
MHTPFTNLTFCIRTFGCQMNKHDSERIAGMLEGMGALRWTPSRMPTSWRSDLLRARSRRHAAVQQVASSGIPAPARRCRSASSLWADASASAMAELVDELKHLDVVFGTQPGVAAALLEAALEGAPSVEVLDAASSLPSCLRRASTNGRHGCPSPSAATTLLVLHRSVCAGARSRGPWTTSPPRRAPMWKRASRRSRCWGRT